MRTSSRRWLAFALGAFLLGGVAQSLFWRWGWDFASAVTNSQFTWALFTWAAGLALSSARSARGALAGALAGLGMIVSYYAMQWAVAGADSAASQFFNSAGVVWLVGAVAGGAVLGLLGAWAGRADSRGAPHRAIGLLVPAALVGVGPALWPMASGGMLSGQRREQAAVVLMFIGLALAAHALRTCSRENLLRGTLISVCLAGLGLGSLWALQAAGILYLTF